MLRVMMKGAPTPMNPDLDADGDNDLDPTQDPDQDQGMGGDPSSPKPKKFDIEKIPQQVAGYLGPEKGPFECGRCVHWEDPNACNVVSGAIDPHGCCNNFEPEDHDRTREPDDQDMGEEAELPEEPEMK